MNKESALIQQANPEAIAALSARIRNGEDPDSILKEAVKAAAEAPGAIGRIRNHLSDLLVDANLQFEGGIFQIEGELTPEDAKRIVETTIALHKDSENVGGMGRWVLGNIAVILEDHGFSLGDLVEPTQLAYNTIAKSAKTFREFRERRFALPFAHHAEIAYAKDLPQEAKYALLELVETNGSTVTHARAMARVMQDRLKTGETDADWQVEALHAHNKALELKSSPKQASFGIVGEHGIQIIHRDPTEAEVASAKEVFKISRFIKRESPDDGAGDDGGGGVPEAVQPNHAAGGTAGGEDDGEA